MCRTGRVKLDFQIWRHNKVSINSLNANNTETSQSVDSANELTGFYMMVNLAFNKLSAPTPISLEWQELFGETLIKGSPPNFASNFKPVWDNSRSF